MRGGAEELVATVACVCTQQEVGAAVQVRLVVITSSPRPSPNGETLLKTATVLRLRSMYRNMSDVPSWVFALLKHESPYLHHSALPILRQGCFFCRDMAKKHPFAFGQARSFTSSRRECSRVEAPSFVEDAPKKFY